MRFILTLTALLAFVSSTEASAQTAVRSDSLAVADVIKRYHTALETGDSTGVLALLSSDATILESGGIETRSEYRSHHHSGDIAFARAVKSTRSEISVTMSGNTAWATSTSTVVGEFNGRSINSIDAETMILTKADEGWRIRSIHWSSRTRRPAR